MTGIFIAGAAPSYSIKWCAYPVSECMHTIQILTVKTTQNAWNGIVPPFKSSILQREAYASNLIPHIANWTTKGA